MTEWDSGQYLQFAEERTQPSCDLVGRIRLDAPTVIVDLGCGPGNSTEVLWMRWPSARLIGVDSSEKMLAAARKRDLPAEWVKGDIQEWSPSQAFDLVFSNAALQWVSNHRRVIPRLWSWVKPGGALAFQVPARPTPPPLWMTALRRMCDEPRWEGLEEDMVSQPHVLTLSDYYAVLGPEAARVDLWDTEYDHVLSNSDAVVEWTRGTALRPWLAQLSSDRERADFLREFAVEVAREYPQTPTGTVLFPFLRRFVVAYRPGPADRSVGR